MRKLFIVLAGLLAGFVFAVIGSVQSAQALPVSSTTSVPATNTTPIQVGTVDQFKSLTLTATGTTAFCNNAPQCFNITPNGGPFACGSAGSCPLNSALVGALIYKVGDGPWQFAGSGPVTVTTTSPTSLPVYVLYNDVFGTYYDNSGSYTVTATGGVVTNPGCTGTIITGTHGAITVPPGVTTCVEQATITGGISVAPGGKLFILDSTVQGSISATSPAALGICGSTTGAISISRATGLVRIGDPASNCAPNTINGGLTASGNTGGGIISGNTITGSWTITNNTPAFTATGNHH